MNNIQALKEKSMEVELRPVAYAEKPLLSNLYQFYHYDFSPYTEEDLNEDGRFEANIDYFWQGDPRWNPYFIMLSGKIAGFLVVLFENLDTDPDPTHVIYDLMVLPKFRRTGVGSAAAQKAFALFKANWAVAQMENNTAAISFWRKAIGEFTNHSYRETYRKDIKKYIQRFSTKS
ncbi:GNAT family N-acetyltransferase [Paenibacillus sp. VCA1]|uniref:GNAT family N-acetyltransferase n=1 Tax=Paenibacillus sp. VCA1 TaxID=3039148 RepID=UPI0028726765|nr:GNAT family N-acetyltransferase [Paenibacillus sp. VCA1]MDR9856491.1 GNAT family N-acetyltransferase [Paenibacillus sp. VCA1]